MKPTIRLLEIGDVANLLAFELANRAYFEQFTEGRPERFFTPPGLDAHVRECLAEYRRRHMFPCVVIDGRGALIGRVNLRNVNAVMKTCDIGYRIGEAHAGLGMATLSVEYLKKFARDKLRLASMSAYVAVDNAASIRVLEKGGFEKIGRLPNFAPIRDGWHDCYEFEHRLLSPS